MSKMLYGELQSEKLADENLVCRQIVREISQFGVTERQRLLIIFLLALEIEDQDRMREITACVKDVAGDELFLSNQKIEEAPGGSFNV